MSETKNLKLFKHNEPLETNENKFDIDLALNQNWDKIDGFAEKVNNKIIELEDKNEEQDFNLQEQNTKLESQIKKDRENMINLEVEGQSIHVEDSSDLEGRLEVLGNVEQKTNLYTGKLEQGTINAEGEVSTANRVRTVDFIKVTAGIKIPVRATGADKFAFATYDNNKKFTSIIGTWTNVGESIAIPSNVNYIKIILGKNDDSNIAVSDITNFVVGNLPSPEYPSEIRAVGDKGSVEIKKQNKNIAPKLKEGKLEKQNTFICNCKKGESFTLSFRGTTTTTDSRLFLRTNTEFTERTDSFIEQEEITLNGTEQKITITSTIDGILYIRTGSGPQIYNFEYLQIEKGKVATEYAEHQEQTKILPIQKPMLEGDCFIKETDSWKEVHNWGKKVFDGTENIIKLTNDNYNRFVFKLPFTGIQGKAISNYYKIGNSKYEREFDVDRNGINLLFHSPSKDITTVEQCKDWLKAKKDSGEPLTFFYKIVKYEELPCTSEQTKILDELDNFPTYKPVTNITTDSIAKLRLKYIADTKTYIDNKTSNLEQQVSVINQLLSTTKTSSVLLDNLQKDIESEVL